LENISYDEIPPAPSDLDSEIEKNLEDNEVLSLSKQEALREKELLVEKLKNLQKTLDFETEIVSSNPIEYCKFCTIQ